MSILTQASLPPLVLNHLNMLLAKIPPLEAAELELKGLVDSVRPEGETDNNSPQRWMNDQQQVGLVFVMICDWCLIFFSLICLVVE